jgi:aspartyl-tRNA(Asn)/glutamyl-tRNA(Gln) amidotransferase subunit C
LYGVNDAEAKSYNTLLEERLESAGTGWRARATPLLELLPNTHMALTSDDVSRIAQLARIEVTPAETQQVLAQLQSIFTLIEELQAVDTRGIEPMSHPQDVVLRLREDAVTERDEHESFQRLAPQVEAGLYLVPKVIE